MTQAEWTAAITEELRTAGYEVRELSGFPLVTVPKEHHAIVAFLKFRTTLAADRRMYAEGCLFLPAGSSVLFREPKSEGGAR